MSKPDSRDQLTVPTFERNGASKPQRQSESTPPTKLRSVSNEEKSLEGTTLDKRFRVLERIGAGGMSEVYKAEHIMLQKMVAIKVLHKQQELEGIERFQQEAKAISALDHRNIVKVYAFGANEDDRLYLAMDFLQGKSLADILEEETRLTWTRVIGYAIQIAEGLEQAHNRGIIHRDLKPSNIIIERDEYNNDIVKVVDFGIAKLTEDSGKEVKDLTQDGNTCGSPPYMSPEQCMGERADARTDIYSLGVMLYELLIGQRPITGRSPFEMMQNHLEQTPAFFKSANPEVFIPQAVEAIVRKCLEKDKTHRFSSMGDMLVDLKSVASDSAYENESSLQQTSRRPEKTANLQRKTLSILLTLTITGAGVFAYHSHLTHQSNNNPWDKEIESIAAKDPNRFEKIIPIIERSLNDKIEIADPAKALLRVRKLQKEVQALSPNNRRYNLQQKLVEFYKKIGRTNEAKQFVAEIISGCKSTAWLENFILANQTKKDEYETLELACKKALQLYKDDPAMLNSVLNKHCVLSTIYSDQGKFEDSINSARTALSLVQRREQNDSQNRAQPQNKHDLNLLAEISVLETLAAALQNAHKVNEAENVLLREWQICQTFAKTQAAGWEPNSLMSKRIGGRLIENYLLQGKNAEAAEIQKVINPSEPLRK
ncbi:MAG: serine/threonine protein kinase [Candidatus Obscuribacterales bacterium]|jgi:serine/threonine protein kinase|nr:serine/threonine protein kinase [Candidatus Obscuribacterales bacterium]